MTLSSIEIFILELARHTVARATIMQQCRLTGRDPLEVTQALDGMLGSGLLEHEQQQSSRPGRPQPIHYTATALGLAQLAKQKDHATLLLPQAGFP